MPAPRTLPADFFDRQADAPPSRLPANFFDSEAKPSPKGGDPQSGPVGRFASSAAQSSGVAAFASPRKLVQGMAADSMAEDELARQAQAKGDTLGEVAHSVYAVPAVGAMIRSHVAQGGEAIKAAQEGRWPEAFGHGLATLLPVLGPAAAESGERVGQQLAEGDYAGAGGTITGAIGQGFLPKIAKESVKALPGAGRVATATVKAGAKAAAETPASATLSTVGALVGGPKGAAIGAAIPKAVAGVKGAYRAGKAALKAERRVPAPVVARPKPGWTDSAAVEEAPLVDQGPIPPPNAPWASRAERNATRQMEGRLATEKAATERAAAVAARRGTAEHLRETAPERPLSGAEQELQAKIAAEQQALRDRAARRATGKDSLQVQPEPVVKESLTTETAVPIPVETDPIVNIPQEVAPAPKNAVEELSRRLQAEMAKDSRSVPRGTSEPIMPQAPNAKQSYMFDDSDVWAAGKREPKMLRIVDQVKRGALTPEEVPNLQQATADVGKEIGTSYGQVSKYVRDNPRSKAPIAVKARAVKDFLDRQIEAAKQDSFDKLRADESNAHLSDKQVKVLVDAEDIVPAHVPSARTWDLATEEMGRQGLIR